jgi:hypothetical protein
LGRALYMKAIHGGKAKNDKIDSHKMAPGSEVACFRKPMSIRLRCGPRVISCAAASI